MFMFLCMCLLLLLYCSPLQNVALIRDPEDPKKFYPRFNIEDTSSFSDLDEHRYIIHDIVGTSCDILEKVYKCEYYLFPFSCTHIIMISYAIKTLFRATMNAQVTPSLTDVQFCSKNVLKRLYYDYYFQRQETLWRQNALKTLPVLLNASDMLACGEDLGMIPSCVHPVRHLFFFFSKI